MRRLPQLAVLVTLPAVCAARDSNEVYTTNAVCLRKNCINPIFPGLEDLAHLEQASWTCSAQQKVMKAVKFCRAALNYDPSLPALDGVSDETVLAKKQDSAAMTMFFYHLAGLGLEAWNYPQPEYEDDCIKSIWRMVCYTYFPRSPLGCQEGQPTTYMRPCQSTCQNYVRLCGVECCDESVQCVFKHRKEISSSFAITQTGYVPHDGPSSLCTGWARRSSGPGLLAWLVLAVQALWLAGPVASSAPPAAQPLGRPGQPAAGWRRAFGLLAVASLSFVLQGCDIDVPTHSVGNWRAEPDYLIAYEFVPPGGPARAGMLNSCSMSMLSPTMQCGGRGICTVWDPDNVDNPTAFCVCDRDWADPECGTRRKSQVVAYVISVFGGMFGADHFYLGFPISGSIKLFTLGGFGLWWIADMIRIGSAPVPTRNFAVAADFPHWAFILCQVSLALVIGFAIAYATLLQHVGQRRKDALLIQSEEEHRIAMGGHPAAVAALASIRKAQVQFAPAVRQDYGTMAPDRQPWIRERL